LWYVLNIMLNTYNLLELCRYVSSADLCLLFTSINNRIKAIQRKKLFISVIPQIFITLIVDFTKAKFTMNVGPKARRKTNI